MYNVFFIIKLNRYYDKEPLPHISDFSALLYSPTSITISYTV